jgi:hypothetical protein
MQQSPNLCLEQGQQSILRVLGRPNFVQELIEALERLGL